MLNKIVLLLGAPERVTVNRLTGKKDVFGKFVNFCLFSQPERGISISLLSDMNFTKNWFCVTKRITSFPNVDMP